MHGVGLVLDFEASCDTGKRLHRGEMEIIEIGAIVVDESFAPVSEFAMFVQPVRHPKLTEFCTALTSIQQADVDGAERFPVVASRLASFAAEHGVAWWGSWGSYDLNQLGQDVRLHGCVNPLPMPHVNLKERFTAQQGLSKRPGLGDGVRLAGLTFTGTAHRGIDDARNIARLMPWILSTAKLSDSAVSGFTKSKRR